MARVRIHPALTIDEITIREYDLDDLPAIDAAIVRNREYLLPWVGDWIKAEPIGLERRGELLGEWVSTYESGADNPVGIFIDGALVGGTGLHDRNAPDDVEIGYWVDQSLQGRGIATRVTARLVDHAFTSPQVLRVLILHNVGNAPSRRIPERLGFRQVQGAHRCGDDPGLMWELTREMWQAASSHP